MGIRRSRVRSASWLRSVVREACETRPVNVLVSVGGLLALVGFVSILVGCSSRITMRIARLGRDTTWREAANLGLGAPWLASRGIRPGAVILLVGVAVAGLGMALDGLL
jgi:hypothetical protein